MYVYEKVSLFILQTIAFIKLTIIVEITVVFKFADEHAWKQKLSKYGGNYAQRQIT